MKIRPFWVILVLTGILWVANLAYAQSQKLDQPIFVDHYVDMWWEESPFLQFYYLANKEDRSIVQSVELGDWLGSPEWGIDSEIAEVDQFGRYSLRRVTVQFNHLPEIQEQQIFHEVTVHFSESPSTVAQIGRIVVHPPSDGTSPFNDNTHSSGDYDKSQLIPGEVVTVESIHTSFDELLQNQFFMKAYSPKLRLLSKPLADGMRDFKEKYWQEAPGVDVRTVEFPFELQQGEPLIVSSTADLKFRAVMDIDIELIGETATKEPFKEKVGYISYPQFTKQEIQQLIEKRTKAVPNE